MTRSLASFILTGSLAALGAGSVVFHAPQAQAACIPNDSICTLFDPTSVSTPTLGAGSLAGGPTTSSGNNYAYARVLFTITNFSGSPFILDNIFIGGPGITGSLGASSAFGSLNVTANGPLQITSGGTSTNGFLALTTPISTVNFSTSTLSFRIPAGVSSGTTISARIQYSDGNAISNADQATSNTASAFTTSAVPGPLPLLGAGVAFSFSRTLRKRIKASNQV